MNEHENKIPTENKSEEASVQPAVTEVPEVAAHVAPVEVPAAPVEAPVAVTEVETPRPENIITKAAKSQQFLTISILISIYAGLPILSAGINVINVLLIIGVWMIYSNAKNTAVTEPLASAAPTIISGTVKAMRIITLVGSILCMVAGVLLGICVSIINAAPDFKEALVAEFQAIQLSFLGNSFRFADDPAFAVAILIGCAIGFIIAGVLLLVLYYCFFYRYLHRFTYSVCENIKNGTDIDYTPALRKWMLVMGILEGVLALLSIADLTTALSTGCYAAAMIITSIWMKNNFETK